MNRQDGHQAYGRREEWMRTATFGDVICAWLSALIIIVPVCLLA